MTLHATMALVWQVYVALDMLADDVERLRGTGHVSPSQSVTCCLRRAPHIVFALRHMSSSQGSTCCLLRAPYVIIPRVLH